MEFGIPLFLIRFYTVISAALCEAENTRHLRGIPMQLRILDSPSWYVSYRHQEAEDLYSLELQKDSCRFSRDGCSEVVSHWSGHLMLPLIKDSQQSRRHPAPELSPLCPQVQFTQPVHTSQTQKQPTIDTSAR